MSMQSMGSQMLEGVNHMHLMELCAEYIENKKNGRYQEILNQSMD